MNWIIALLVIGLIAATGFALLFRRMLHAVLLSNSDSEHVVYRRIEFRKRIAALLLNDRDDLLDGLNVKDDHAVLRSVITLMDAKCQAHLEAAAVSGLAPDEAKAEARCASAMQEIQEIILETAEEARKVNA